MIIGLTGGIASGKSTVGKMLVELGAHLIDADQVAREVVLPGEATLQAIASHFGQAMLLPDGSLDRKRLGGIVFQNKDELAVLESITHPAIRKRMQEKITAASTNDPLGLVVADVPLLYETKQEKLYEGIMVVYVPRQMQIERLVERDGMDSEEAIRRVELQLDIEEKRSRADWVIHNTGTIEETNQQVLAFWKSKDLP